MSRRYLRAINEIRSFYVSEFPEIGPHVKMPTDPTVPSFTQIGAGASLFVSYVGTALLLVVLTLTLCISAAAFLLMDGLGLSGGVSAAAGVTVGVAVAGAIAVLEVRRISKRLTRAQEMYG
jgi:hypothetical protein